MSTTKTPVITIEFNQHDCYTITESTPTVIAPIKSGFICFNAGANVAIEKDQEEITIDTYDSNKI